MRSSHPRAFSASIIGKFWTKKTTPRSRLARPPGSSFYATALLRSPRASRRLVSRMEPRCPLSLARSFVDRDRQWWAGGSTFRDVASSGRRVEVRFLPRLAFANPRSLIFAKKNQSQVRDGPDRVLAHVSARSGLFTSGACSAASSTGFGCSNARSTRPSASSRALIVLPLELASGVRSVSGRSGCSRQGANHAL